ncbi:MAG: hypothetical protein AB1697_04960 [Pseudomonadota bacterium]
MDTSNIKGRLALHPAEALLLAGLSRDMDAARKTARNKISRGIYPFRVRRIGKQNVVLVKDVLEALGLQEPEAPGSMPQPQRRGPGRPRRSEGGEV